MSDDDEVPIFGMKIPPAAMEAMERMRSLHQMEVSQIRHSVYRLIDILDQEQLMTLDLICIRVAEDPHFGHFVSGYIDGVLEKKYDTCPACGDVKSSHEPESLLNRIDETINSPIYTFEDRMNLMVTSDMREKMNLYGLDDVWDLGTEKFLHYQCAKTEKSPFTGCGQQYPSIEDRMLRPPGIDGCGNCQLRSGHG